MKKKRNPPSPTAAQHKREHDRLAYTKNAEAIRSAKRESYAKKMKGEKLDADVLRQVLKYEPLTGHFTRVQARGAFKEGSPVGTLRDDGYLQVCVNRKTYAAHRLAWLWMTGNWPTSDIDHINGNRTDNRWSNLRDVSRTVNLQNRRGVSSNKKHSALLGAHWNESTQSWKSSIRVNGRIKSLGAFPTDKAAHDAYVAAKRQLHEGCTL